MFTMILITIESAIGILAGWLAKRDENDFGPDDAFAAGLMVLVEGIKEYRLNGLNRRVIVLLLEMVKVICERWDEGWDGWDDKVADYITKIQGILES